MVSCTTLGEAPGRPFFVKLARVFTSNSSQAAIETESETKEASDRFVCREKWEGRKGDGPDKFHFALRFAQT